MEKILIIGSTGFIGKNLRAYFERNTNFSLLTPTRQQLNLLNEHDCKMYLQLHKPDLVVHAAVDISSVENTLTMFFNIFKNRNCFGHFIQIGSGAEYDKRSYQPKIEESLFGKSVPIDTYGMAKYFIAREMENSGVGYSINLRIFGIFGPHEDYHRRFISNNICRVLAGHSISLNRDMYFDYIDVDDLGKLILRLINILPLNDVSYNFCSGTPILLTEIASIISRKMGVNSGYIVQNEGMNPEYSGSPIKIIKEIGVFDFTPIENSISRLIEFYTNNFNSEQLSKFKVFINEK
jgi:UDP-glucose 4-epimerase